MDLSLARAFVTVLCLVSFLGIAFWAYSGARRQRFEQASRCPLDDSTLNQAISESTPPSEGR